MDILSTDSAVALLDSLAISPEDVADPNIDVNPENDVADEDTLDLDDEDSEDAPNPSDDASEDENPGDGEDAEDDDNEAAAPIDAPQWWDADAKAAFAELTPEAQAVVFAQEEKREAITQKAKQEAAEARKAADTARAEITAKASEISDVAEKAAVLFVRKWDGIDWPAYYQQDFRAATIHRAEFEQEQVAMRELLNGKTKADAEAEQHYLQSEAAALQELAKTDPVVAALFDEKEGQNRLNEVAQYLVGQGVPAEQLKLISAQEMSIVRKAMLYDQAQAVAAGRGPKPSTAQQPSPQGKPMRSAARPAVSPPVAGVRVAAERFSSSGSVDDAVALLSAREANHRKKK